MGFSSGNGGSGTIAGSSDVVFSNPSTNHVIIYNPALSKWVNGPVPGSVTASVSTQTSGSLVLTPGTSAQVTKLKATLSANLTVSFSNAVNSSVFELSFIETVFNGNSVTVGSDVFSYPTFVRYICIAGSWERVL